MAIASPRAGALNQAYRRVPLTHTNEEEHRHDLALGINTLLDGKINAKGTVTLAASSTTTTLADLRIGSTSVVLFTPLSSNAATAMANLYVSSRGDQTATLTHANNSQTDRDFAYVVLG